MKLNCEVKVKRNYKNIKAIIDKLPETINKSVEEVLKNIQGYAIRLEKRAQRRWNNSGNGKYVN